MATESDSPNVWLETDWKASDLNGRTVEFRLLTKSGYVLDGHGRFDVLERPGIDNLKQINILAFEDRNGEGTSFHHRLNEFSASKIVKNPNGSPYEFSLFVV